MHSEPDGVEVLTSWAQVDGAGRAPLLVLDRVTEFFDAHGLGAGPLTWQRVGDGQSNLTYRIRRGRHDFVLRRGPRPPLPRSTHDMIREARIQQLLRPHGVPVPQILAVCEDESLLGVPFYVMEYLDGAIITTQVPAWLDTPDRRRDLSIAVIDTLVTLHAVDVTTGPIHTFGRPDGFLERQVSRFAALWDVNTTRTLPEVGKLASWLADNVPASQAASVVHGDFRLGNIMFQPSAPVAPRAILDWEMATLGDPLTDLGYLTATHTDPDTAPNPLHLSPVTAGPGFLTSHELAQIYADRTGVDLTTLPWYQALALWKAAIFCEAIYTRWLRGERPHDTTFAPALDEGIPALLAAATRYAERS